MMKTAHEKIKIMQASEDGAEIEYSPCSAPPTWEYTEAPIWSWGVNDYRIKKPPTGSGIVRSMLKRGKPVWCSVSDASQYAADNPHVDPLVAVFKLDKSGGFVSGDGCCNTWNYASPVDTSKFASYVPEVKE